MRLSEIKRTFFANRVTGATLAQLMRNYFISQGIGGSTNDEMERNWLKKIIVDNGGDVVTNNYLSELYKSANAALGFSVTNRLLENQKTFYLRYTP